jgi:hypothetical protein
VGTYAIITGVRDEDRARIEKKPELLWRLTAPDDPDLYLDEVKPRSFILAIKRLIFRGDAVQEATKAADVPSAISNEGVEFDMDKAWHGVHFALAGNADGGNPPLDFLVAGGTFIDTLEPSARSFTAAAVREIHDALSAVTDNELEHRLDGELMTKLGIYPSIWHRDLADDDWADYVMENVTVLRHGLGKLVEKQLAMIVHLNY